MRVAFIETSQTIHSFGSRTLSAVLRHHGHQVRKIYLNSPVDRDIPTDQLCGQVADLIQDVDLIAFSVISTNYFPRTARVAKYLRGLVKTPIIIGGIHATIMPEECLNYADMVCVGEGENSLPVLVEKLQNGEDPTTVAGFWHHTSRGPVIHGHGELIHDLSTVPPPEYRMDDEFLLHRGKIVPMTLALIASHTRRIYHTLSTRGCPYHCTYCFNASYQTIFADSKPIRKRPFSQVIDELATIKQKWPFLERIAFDDDSFLARNMGELEEFAREYRQRIALPIHIGGVNAPLLTREKLELLVEAGLEGYISMGLQSGSERILKMYGRKISGKQFLKAARLIHEFKEKFPNPSYDIIVDNPWEDNHDLIDTIQVVTQIPPPFFLRIYVLNLYPGTELYKRALAEGRIDNYLQGVGGTLQPTYLNRGLMLIRDHAQLGWPFPAWKHYLLTREWLASRRYRWLHPLLLLLMGINLYTSKLYWKKKYWNLLAKRRARNMAGLE